MASAVLSLQLGKAGPAADLSRVRLRPVLPDHASHYYDRQIIGGRLRALPAAIRLQR